VFRPFYRGGTEMAGSRDGGMLGNANGDAAGPRLGAPRSVTGLRSIPGSGKSPDATAARLGCAQMDDGRSSFVVTLPL